MIKTLARLREEDGFSLITAVLISVVVFLLSVTTIALTVQDTSQSGRNRERVNAIAAAEAGLNYQFSKLQAGMIECSATQDLPSFPASSFESVLTTYDMEGNEYPDPNCPPPGAPAQFRVKIESVGHATGPDPVRKMEAFVELERTVGAPLDDSAIFAEGDLLIDSNPQIGDPDGDFDANVYSNNNIWFKSNPVVEGSVISQKCVRLESTSQVKLDVRAKGISGSECGRSLGTWDHTIWMQSDSKVFRDVIATTRGIRFESNSHVFRDARAGGNINPWQPTSHVDGVAQQNQANLPAPDVKAFPVLNTSDLTPWEADGYKIPPEEPEYTTCAAAKTAIGSNNTVKRVIRIKANCELKWSNSSSNPITLSADLAIIHDGHIVLDGDTRFTPFGGPHRLHFIVGRGSPPDTCFEMKSNAKVEPGIKTLVHARPIDTSWTKCRVFLDSNTRIAEGQVIGNKIDIFSNSAMAYDPVITPGAPTTGFKESIIYIRETRPN